LFALAPAAPSAATPAAAPAVPLAAPKLLDLEFHAVPLTIMVRLLETQLDSPIWVPSDANPPVDVVAHARPALEIFDDVLAQAKLARVEVAALRLAPGGRGDASVLGGAPVTASFHATPLNYVLDQLEPALAMPISRVGTETPPGTTDESGAPELDASPPITLELHGEPAGVALERALAQAHLGYELSTGFVVVSDATQ
jgi:hypothetical protein